MERLASWIRRTYYRAERLALFSDGIFIIAVLAKATINQIVLRIFALSNRFDVANFSDVPGLHDNPLDKILLIVGTGPTRALGLESLSSKLETSTIISINDESRDPELDRIRLTEKWKPGYTRLLGYPPKFNLPWFEVMPRTRADRRALRYERDRVEGPKFYLTLDTMTADVRRAADLFFNRKFTKVLSKVAPSVLLGSQASVIRAVGLGIRSSHYKMVLIGIDFVLDEYIESERGVSIEEIPEQRLHKTGKKSWAKTWRSVTVLELLLKIDERLRADGLGGLYVGHHDSPLHQHLPLLE